MARSSGVPQRLRGYDSWIDIPSQPSSQSQSPVNSEIVTTGLRVQQTLNSQRRRRPTPRSMATDVETRCTSSQEEYEESESDEDHVLTSSSEHLETKPLTTLSSLEVDLDSDRDESSKSLPRGAVNEGNLPDPYYDSLKIPQSQRHHSIESFLSPSSSNIHPSNASRNFSHQHPHRRPTDHDAALRASLTTLLSIGAAAARGLPSRESNINRNNTARNRDFNEPIGLRFVSESELMTPSHSQSSPPVRKATNGSGNHAALVEKGRRKVSMTEKTKALQKNQQISRESILSSTFLTWTVSAGVLVIISVVGFGAGYVIGREVGKQETLAGLNSSVLGNSSACGRETIRSSSAGLKRFKWNIGGVSRNVIT